MAVLQNYAFQNVPAAGTGQSSALPCGHLTNKTVFLGGGAYTADVEVSHNGTMWVDATGGGAKAVTTAGVIVTFADSAAFVRINVTAYTSGTPAASLLGHSSEDGT